jgi:acyl carrier protein
MTMSPHEIVAEYVRSRFRSSIPFGSLAADTPLFSSGMIDSFGVLELIAFLEDRFHVEIDPSRHDLVEFDTIGRIVRLVERARQP